MNTNLYKITVEHLEDSKGNSVEIAPLVFETRNQEDIFKIVEKIKAKVDLDEDETNAFAVGLKLFSGVLMNHKDNEFFKKLIPHFKDLMKELKNP